MQAEAWPDVRDADELHDVLHTLVAMPVNSSQLSALSSQENHQPISDSFAANDGSLVARRSSLAANWQVFFERLITQRRALVAEDGEKRYWVAAERAETFAAMHPTARSTAEDDLALRLHSGQAAGGAPAPPFSDAVLTAVQGWMTHLGPTTASEIGELLGVSASEIEKSLLRIEASGAILRGKFRPQGIHQQSSASETEWCERRLLARIHRLTVATLRKQIEPVTASQFMNWLLRWQHIAPGSQVRGEHGTLEVIRQLQGFEIPANTWERFVLARRISDYDPAYVDQLCLAGVVGWGRLSPHPAALDASNGSGGNSASSAIGADGELLEAVAPRQRRVIPTRVAPIAFFVREESDWMKAHPSHGSSNAPSSGDDSPMSYLSPVARALFELMKQRGALFFPDMVRATGRLKAEVETGLWELVAVGLVTADGFENLRALVAPKNSANSGSGTTGSKMFGAGMSASGAFGTSGLRMAKTRRPRHAAGRWSLLHMDGAEHGKPKTGTERDQSVESCCWMLLRRYGVVFRDLLARETNLPRWRELQIAFRRLEDRGEIRGGRFVDGFVGEQFALPIAVESLRANRKLPMNGERTVIAAADPLNLVGIIVPGERIPAISGRSVTFRDGQWEPEGETLMAAGYS